MKWLMTCLLLALITVVIAVGGIGMAQAQGDTPPAPTGLVAVNGPNPGEALLSWNAVADAAFYRIGWVAFPDYEATVAAGRDWLEAFHFLDAANTGQTQWTLTRLSPGVQYYFIIASNDARNGPPQYGEWSELLTLNDDTSSCPTAAPEPEPTPTPRPTPTPTRGPVADGDYDADNDGLIEVSNRAQLNAIRFDLDGNASSSNSAYISTFPDAMSGMGCPASGCTGYELKASINLGDSKWRPIGDSDHKFNATFDGNGHTISHMSMIRSDLSSGLFYGVDSGGVIHNIRLASVSVRGRSFAGSLVGVNRGTISNSYATGSVFGSFWTGGLVGINHGAISVSHFGGSVSGGSEIGGLVGRNTGEVSASYADVVVSGNRDDVGGLVGANHGTVIASYAAGSVSGNDDNIGGLIGKNNDGIITNSYSTSLVSGSGSTIYVGGLIGYDDEGTITASYWNTQSSGQTGSDGGVGKTTRELQSPTSNTGIYATWNADWWDFGTSRQYPALKYGGLSVAAQR